VVAPGKALDRALELARRMAEYPQASLRADRAATLATWGLSLAAGLRLEAETCLPMAADPEMTAGLARFAGRDRPDAPRPS